MKVKPAKANRKGKGDSVGTEIRIHAASGATLKATLDGPGLSLPEVTLRGPDGTVIFDARQRRDRVIFQPTVLSAGDGIYTIVVPRPVSFKWTLKPPPKVKDAIQEREDL